MDYRAGLCDKGVQQQLREVRDHKPERGEFCNASSHSHKTQLLPRTGKAAHLGWFGRKELSGCLGDSCSLRSRAGIKVSHGHAKPSPVVPGCLNQAGSKCQQLLGWEDDPEQFSY